MKNNDQMCLYNKSFCVLLCCLHILSTNVAREQYKNNIVAPDAATLDHSVLGGNPINQQIAFVLLSRFYRFLLKLQFL